MSPAYIDSFTSSLEIWITYICFCGLIFMAKISNAMLNRSVNSKNYLVSDLRGNHSAFHQQV